MRGTSEEDKPFTVDWNGKTYISYETERAGKRGNPSARYAMLHPFPTYSKFGNPIFVDDEGRHYRTGDGFDALEFEKANETRTNRFWEPSDDILDDIGNPGELQFLYVRSPIKENIKRRRRKLTRLSVPTEGERLVLIHLKTKVLYQCKVRSAVNIQNAPRESCGSVVIQDIEEAGTASKETAKRVKEDLPRGYKKLIKV